MSFTIHGIAVSSGIAIGHAHLVSHTSLEVAHYTLPRQFVSDEVARFDAALEAVHREFTGLRSHRPTLAAAEFDTFLELHQMILADPQPESRASENATNRKVRTRDMANSFATRSAPQRTRTCNLRFRRPYVTRPNSRS